MVLHDLSLPNLIHYLILSGTFFAWRRVFELEWDGLSKTIHIRCTGCGQSDLAFYLVDRACSIWVLLVRKRT